MPTWQNLVTMNRLSKIGIMGAEKRWSKYNLEIQNFLSNNKLIENYPKELSALCGFLAGDGSFDKRYTHYEIKFFPDDKKVAILFEKIFQKLYNKKLKIRKQIQHFGNCYVLRIKYKKAYMHLKSLTTFGRMSWRIPDFVLNNDELKIEWLKAFFDCEGYVNPNGKVIQLQSVNEIGLKQVKNILESLEITSKIYTYERKNKNWNTNFILNITGENMEKFHNLIGFNHSKKIKRLKKVIAKRWVSQVRFKAVEN